MPVVDGNRVDIYNNGDEFYPAMLDAIESARHKWRCDTRPNPNRIVQADAKHFSLTINTLYEEFQLD